jgi:hypothetical protein
MKRHSLVAALALATALATVAGLHPPAARAASHCVGAEEAMARAAGDSESEKPKFTNAFYRRLFVLDVSLDGVERGELPISIEQVCNVPKPLRKQAAQLAGNDGVALLLGRTTVWQGDTQLTGDEARTALDGADTALLRVRLTRPQGWSKDEDGDPVPTFRTGRIQITD